MAREIAIDPVTRIEGHARITIHLDDDGQVEDARFHVTQFRGFEKFCEGRPLHEMPSITARICGICPVSHLIASSKACDMLLAVSIPETARKLRRVLNLAQIMQSNALSFFHLSSPDLLLGMDAPEKERNIFHLFSSHPEMARDGIKLRKFGQQIVEWLAGKRIHPAWVVPGGVSRPLSEDLRDRMLEGIPDARETILRTIKAYKRLAEDFRDEIRSFGNFPSMFMGLVTPEGDLEMYDGRLRFMDAQGEIVADQVPGTDYRDYIGEAVEPWTYLKFPYYKGIGYPDGIYRVGPLARMNIVDACGTPLADEELAEFRELQRGPALSSFHFHYARLIEILFCIEHLEELLNDPELLGTKVRAQAGPNATEGIGVAEAPRGTLIHHYRADENGLIEEVNLVIATCHNNLAMNKSVKQVAERFVDGADLQDGALNRVEAVIRAYDPCLSCSTHAAGQMPLHLQLIGPEGEVLDELKRD
ncbi:MAG: Ni/Fe hydrogenase subunit alpha [Candidatus Brocadiia bacterium]